MKEYERERRLLERAKRKGTLGQGEELEDWTEKVLDI